MKKIIMAVPKGRILKELNLYLKKLELYQRKNFLNKILEN